MIYVDNYLRKYRGMRMSHLMSDLSLEELHEFAARLGLKRRWFQYHVGGVPHYDVSQAKRRLAFSLGAKPLPIRVNDQQNPEWRRVMAAAKRLMGRTDEPRRMPETDEGAGRSAQPGVSFDHPDRGYQLL